MQDVTLPWWVLPVAAGVLAVLLGIARWGIGSWMRTMERRLDGLAASARDHNAQQRQALDGVVETTTQMMERLQRLAEDVATLRAHVEHLREVRG